MHNRKRFLERRGQPGNGPASTSLDEHLMQSTKTPRDARAYILGGYAWLLQPPVQEHATATGRARLSCERCMYRGCGTEVVAG